MEVHYCDADDAVSVSTITELTLYDLTPHTTYSFVLTANNSAGESPDSPLVVYLTDFHEPEKITQFIDPPVRGDQCACPPPRVPASIASPHPALMFCTLP